jgi:hypothetical protein
VTVTSTDIERDAFMTTLRLVLREVSDLEQLREHAHFRAMLAIHGAPRVRGWVILEGLRLARQVALGERVRTDLADGDAWLSSGVLQRLCANADYLTERIPR